MSSVTSTQFDQHLKRFGLDSFRRGQLEVIETVMQGGDCLCIMPTGGGKSLCYQLPSVAREGVTIVVSPLIALMKDQVDALTELGIRATCINSSIGGAEQRARIIEMEQGLYDLVYIAPERLRNQTFADAVRKTKVQLLAIDEAHCVSEWGHDFRPDYARLGLFRERLGFPTTIALTATATPLVRDDIVDLLKLQEPQTFISGFARTNLHFEVLQPSSVIDKNSCLLQFIKAAKGAGIIYASTRKGCEEIAEMLTNELGEPIGLYHGGMLPDNRRQMQESFMHDDVRIMVATNAFGMGIDKSDLRFVLHYNLPGSLEAYYQEAGRAGRDGLPSHCVLLFSYGDKYIQEFFIESAYPSREAVSAVYEYLRRLPQDPVEITLAELKEVLDLSISNEGVSACEKVLEKSGAIVRLDSQQNLASVRLDSDLPTLVDLLPKEVKSQRRVLRAFESIVGKRRGDWVYFQAAKLESLTDMEKVGIGRAIRELKKLKAFDYIPPFRGRAVHVVDRDVPFRKLEIDFHDLDKRKQAELDKLDQVIDFARTGRCRQMKILDYFGDPDRKPCGACDNCGGLIDSKRARKENVEVDAAINQAVRMALSGIARAQGRFGKNIIAQMLSGSKSTKMKKFRLDKLSTFGLFKQLTQVEVAELLDMLINCGLAQQDEVDRFRPLLTITDEGKEVMRGEANARLSLESVLAARLRMVGAKHLSADDATQAEIKSSADQPQTDNRLLRRLRTWRTETAVELGWPPFRVVHDATMQRIAAVQPNSLDALLEIRGVGQQKVDQFGVQILEIVCPATCSSEEPVVVATTAVSTEKSTVGVIDETESKVDSPNDEVEVLDDVPTGSRAAGSHTAGSHTAGSHTAGGELADGELADGELAGGELADGELADGELADGELADGGSQTDRAEDVGSSGTRTRVETDGTT
ncbi:MAG: ATP-dependent DNA helicase RecQ, partial [Pirellulaceae bacterium]